MGFSSDKPFKPHLTVFRIKKKIGDITEELEEKRTMEYDLSHARAEMEKLAIEIEMRKEELSILDEKLRRADET